MVYGSKLLRKCSVLPLLPRKYPSLPAPVVAAVVAAAPAVAWEALGYGERGARVENVYREVSAGSTQQDGGGRNTSARAAAATTLTAAIYRINTRSRRQSPRPPLFERVMRRVTVLDHAGLELW